MSGFWNSSLGEITGNSEDAFVKQFRIIPDNTAALAKIVQFRNEKEFLNIEWELIDGEFKGQKVNQKIKVYDSDAKIKHRALNMFKLLYQLFKMSPKDNNSPTDNDLALFIGKIAGIKIRETEPNENGKQYNWVSEVHGPSGFKSETGIKVVVTHRPLNTHFIDSAFARNSNNGSNMENDIPF